MNPHSGAPHARQQSQHQSQEWPKRLAFLAALLFVIASSTTNLLYGLAKGTDLATSLVWAAVAIATSIVFSLSWPALLAAIDQRQWARCAMVAVALLLSGAYSVSAALGSALVVGRTRNHRDSHNRRAPEEHRWRMTLAKAEFAA